MSTNWVACGRNGSNTAGNILYSTDGISWQTSTNASAIFTYAVNDIATNGSIWVAVGLLTTGRVDEYQCVIGYSYDGNTWSTAPSITGDPFQYVGSRGYYTATAVGYGNGKFIAVGSVGSLFSTNGINWSRIDTGINSAYPNNNFTRIIYKNSKWYIFGLVDYYNYNTVSPAKMNLYSSNDGTSWTIGSYADRLSTSFDYNGTNYVFSTAIGFGYSSDINLTNAGSYNAGIGSSSKGDVKWTGTEFIACLSNSNNLYKSLTGASWTSSNVLTSGGYALNYFNNFWLIGQVNGMKYSTDGVTWNNCTGISGTSYRIERLIDIGTAPTINNITVGISTFSVNFTAGTGYPVPTTYKYSLNGGSYIDANNATSPIVISTGLTKGVTYAVRLIATNIAGDTVASEPVNAILPTIGTKPTINSISVIGSTFSVVFTPGTGGSPAPTTYKYSLNGGAYVDAGRNTSPITISSGLTQGATYAVRLIATNVAGDSSGSDPVNAIFAGVGTPPTITSISVSGSTFSVVFTPGTGGFPAPTTYKYSLNGGAYVDAGRNTSPITISSGLTPGVIYAVRLIATNLAGDSSGSTPFNAAIPNIGTTPTITSITSETSSLNVNFTASTGGYPVPTYKYSINGGAYINTTTTASPLVIAYNTLTRGDKPTIRIIATNSVGDTAASNMMSGFVPYPCFLQGSKILRMNPETDEEEYVPVESLRRGDLIKTANHGYKAIELIGHRPIKNPLDIPTKSSRLYWFRKSRIPGLKEDLCVTGDHCILHKNISDEKRAKIREYMGNIYLTEDHYRVPAFLDDRSEPYKESEESVNIWHFVLENPNIYHNYGVMANGLLVESCSLDYMVNHSDMNTV